MIEAIDLRKAYATRHSPRTVLDGLSLRLARGERLGIVGRNGAGKSTLVRILGGAEQPDRGQVRRGMSVSWPLAWSGGFQSGLSGDDNLRFICRLYGVDIATRRRQVEDFSELGRYMREPVRSYSSGMRARLAFALSLAIDFDCLLIDEVIAVGDDRFRERCRQAILHERAERALVLVSHDPGLLAEYCNRFAVLADGRLTEHPTLEAARSAYASHEGP